MHEYEVDWRPFDMKIYPGTLGRKKQPVKKTDWGLIIGFMLLGVCIGYLVGILQAATW